jgi:hypothetical protein
MEELDLHTCNISWLLCPIFYGTVSLTLFQCDPEHPLLSVTSYYRHPVVPMEITYMDTEDEY